MPALLARNSAAAETPVVERFAFTTGQERGRAKIFTPVGSRSDSFGAFPPTPFLFARPSENYQNSASGFSLKKVRILFRTDSQFVKFAFSPSLGASPLASVDEFSSNFQGFLYSTKTSRSRRSGFEPIFFRKFFFSEKFPRKAAICA